MARIMLKSTNFSIHWYRRALLGLMALGLVACGGGGGGGVVLDESNDETVGDEVSSYTVTPTAGTGGSISPATAQTVTHGATTSFTLTPVENYSIDTVSGCDGSLEGNTYTTGEITADCTVQASFVLPAPQGLATTAGHQVNLGWSAVPNATEYCVYVSDSAGITLETADSYDLELSSCTGNTNTLYTTTSLAHGTQYYFVVTTKDSAGSESTMSTEISATPVSSPLNDTGIDSCANDVTKDLPCPVVDFLGQDAEYGRDNIDGSLLKVGGGHAGFDFTKVCNSGELAGEGNCPVNPAPGSAENEWACTLDNNTGLMWELKVNNPGSLHHMDHTFTWYNSDANTNGDLAGTEGGDTCNSTVIAGCDTEKLVATVNDGLGLCGYKDWRLADRRELLSIVNNDQVTPAIDDDWLGITPSEQFWSSSPFFQITNDAWAVSFDNGAADLYGKSEAKRVRLVRAGQ